MLAKAFSFGINGLDAHLVTIETDISPGLPNFTLVGLADMAVRESRERVRSAIKHSNLNFPQERITVNLAPADTRKHGPSFDTAIALSILAAAGFILTEPLKNIGFVGELSLNGELKPVPGVLAMAMACKTQGFNALIVAHANAREAALVSGLIVYPANHLSDIVTWLSPQGNFPPAFTNITENSNFPTLTADFNDVKGQLAVKRGLEIAAAGGHNILLIGPPGSGKTMLAKRLVGILPPLSQHEALEVTRIHSVITKGQIVTGLLTTRPFRAPHHTASNIALIGGGSAPQAGEVTFAHHGILFLDELPEFSRHVLETLRQPLEDGYVQIARARQTYLFPARFMLVAAMNPCPCGFKTDITRQCRCSPIMIERYHQKISGPLLDRIDMHLHVPALSSDELINPAVSESSTTIYQRTCKARLVAHERFKDTAYSCNAYLPTHLIKKFCPLDMEGRELLAHAIKKLHLSARAYDRIIRVARTIADLDNSEAITPAHLAEAISYRTLDKN